MAKLNTGTFAMALVLCVAFPTAWADSSGYSNSNYSNGSMDTSSTSNALMYSGMAGGVAGGNNPCNNSKSLDSAVGTQMQAQCQSSQSIMTMSAITNIVGQQAAAAGQQVEGNAALTDASNQNTLVAQAEANAAMAKTAAGSELGLGGMNAGLAAYQIMTSSKHFDNVDTIKTESDAFKKASVTRSNQDGDIHAAPSNRPDDGYVYSDAGAQKWAQKIITKDDANLTESLTTYSPTNIAKYKQDIQNLPQQIDTARASNNAVLAGQLQRQLDDSKTKLKEEQDNQKQRDSQITSRVKSMTNDVKSVENGASAEQASMGQSLKNSGIMSAIMAGSQMLKGGLDYMAAIQAENAAKALAAVAASPTVSFLPDAGAVAPPNTTNGAVTSLSPDTLVSPTPAPGALGPSGPIGDLGQPFNTNTTDAPQGPTAGGFTAGNAANPPPGAPAAGAAGGGGTQPAKDEAQDTAPKPADNRVPSLYGGGGYSGGAVNGGVGADKGPDLSGLLAQFLPKKDDANKEKHDIMDFANRGPASASGNSEPYSYLGRDVNLFQRVSERMQEKSRLGSVGI